MELTLMRELRCHLTVYHPFRPLRTLFDGLAAAMDRQARARTARARHRTARHGGPPHATPIIQGAAGV